MGLQFQILLKMHIYWADEWQNQQNDLCCRGRLRSAMGTGSVWSESLLSVWRSFGYLATHKTHNQDSDHLSPCWVHRSFCWFCHGLAPIKVSFLPKMEKRLYEGRHCKLYILMYTPSKDSDQLAHTCQSLSLRGVSDWAGEESKMHTFSRI